MGGTHYYIETDGQVYLVKRGDRWSLPRSREEIPFEVETNEQATVLDRTVTYCTPKLDRHPYEWHHKDDIPGLDSVEPLVRQAMHVTLPRVVAEAVIIREEKLLLVKPLRGFNAGMWTLPGGFVSHGESPAQTVEREVREEVGTDARVGECLGVETFVGRNSSYTWHMFFYRAMLEVDEFQPAPDEIEDVRWFALSEARQLLRGVMRRKIEQLHPSLSGD